MPGCATTCSLDLSLAIRVSRDVALCLTGLRAWPVPRRVEEELADQIWRALGRRPIRPGVRLRIQAQPA